MAAEELLLNLFESNWFGHEINTSPDHEDKTLESDESHEFLVPQNLKLRSLSEQLLDSKIGSFFSSENSLSPSSVLAAPAKLETIFSGKEAKHQEDQAEEEALSVKKKKKRESERRRRHKKVASKSLTELEFEELKGFMDLGFVFTEDVCKDSKLVSMIPGLQRYCKKCTGSSSSSDNHQMISLEYDDHDHDHEAHDDDDGVIISRPYLSEAWDVLEQREKKEQIVIKPVVMDWKISDSFGNEDSMKNQLRFWAHSVASAVR